MSLNGVIIDVLDLFPIGYIYMSTAPTNPGDLFGGTWEELAPGRVLMGASDTYPAGSTGGETTHEIIEAEMPNHTHSGSTDTVSHTHTITATSRSGMYQTSVSTGYWSNGDVLNSTSTSRTTSQNNHSHTLSIEATGGREDGTAQPISLMQPYLAVYMWERVA